MKIVRRAGASDPGRARTGQQVITRSHGGVYRPVGDGPGWFGFAQPAQRGGGDLVDLPEQARGQLTVVPGVVRVRSNAERSSDIGFGSRAFAIRDSAPLPSSSSTSICSASAISFSTENLSSRRTPFDLVHPTVRLADEDGEMPLRQLSLAAPIGDPASDR
jgi:hypothetical protein